MKLGTVTDGLHVVWDSQRQKPTLGGALVLRQEAELLADAQRHADIFVHGVWDQFAQQIFSSSAIRFRHSSDPAPSDTWPMKSSETEFSYFSFTRLVSLHQATGAIPRLKWKRSSQEIAICVRRRFSGKLVCVHLKNVYPYNLIESNADKAPWVTFFHRHAKEGKLNFLLLGDDSLPDGMPLSNGVSRAVDLGLDLATQLALIVYADGFLGMASGICTAANFSATPHVIFKHPAHHADEMRKELGDADKFPFATDVQRLWRRTVSVHALDEALALVMQ